MTPEATSGEAARAFLSGYGVLFGPEDQARDLSLMRVRDADRGRSFVRFQRMKNGIAVLGSELIVQLDAKRNVLSVSGELLPGAMPGLEPTAPPPEAQDKALALVARVRGVKREGLLADTPSLWIYSPALFGSPGLSADLVVWRMQVRSSEDLALRELVLVDARRGGVVLQFEWYPQESSYFDGAIVAYSTDGGTSWRDAGSMIVENGYNATLFAQGDNPLAGWRAFGGESCGYISSRLDLSSLAGSRVRFAFVVATDKESLLQYYGWFIDDVRIYTCGPGMTPEPTETRTPVATRSPTRTPTSRPFTPSVRVGLPIVLRDAWLAERPTPTEPQGPSRTPTRTSVATRTATPTRTLPGPTPTGVPGGGGPDAFGYTWTSTEYNWIDAKSGGLPINWGNRGPFNIGFSFRFYGVTYNQFYLNSGMLQFGRSDSWSQANACIPNPGPPNSFAAAFWDAVGSYQSAPGTFYRLVGEAPNRVAVVLVSGLQHVNDGAPMSFEVLLCEGSNDIVFQYQSMLANSRGDAREATIGLEDSSGRIALQASCNQTRLYDGVAIRFVYPQ